MASSFPNTWFYQDQTGYSPLARFNCLTLGKPTATAFEIALEFHLRELEKKHGHCISETRRTCHECRSQLAQCAVTRVYKSLLDVGLQQNVDPKDVVVKRRELDKETKAIYHILAVHERTFHMRMDPKAFDKRHSRS